ncbi:MAG: hypothetical protein JXA96_00055 [Sedimentisphaerales bacterium]|nr:hypothetical protein [Sedimentisphaerales bacterium]
MAPKSESIADQIQWDALRHQASRFTYCLIDETKLGIGTAIAVKLEQRFFFVSAKHLIDNNHDLQILPRNSLVPVKSPDFKAKHCHELLDVGFIELNANVSNQFDFVDGTQLLEEIDIETELPTLVIGYPSQFIRSSKIQITSKEDLLTHRCDALVYRSIVLPKSEWPNNSSLCNSLECGTDILVDFKSEPRIKCLSPNTFSIDGQQVDCAKINPEGMSGGGIWLASVKEHNSGVRQSDARLIGIQTGYYNNIGLLKGLRIGVWLKMVKTAYPDL